MNQNKFFIQTTDKDEVPFRKRDNISSKKRKRHGCEYSNRNNTCISSIDQTHIICNFNCKHYLVNREIGIKTV